MNIFNQYLQKVMYAKKPKNQLSDLSPEQKLEQLNKYMIYWIDHYSAIDEVFHIGENEVTVMKVGPLFLLSFSMWYAQCHCRYCGAKLPGGLIPNLNHWEICELNPSILKVGQ